MTRYLTILPFLIFLLGCKQSEPTSTPNPPAPHLFAHRGLCEYTPENTLPAFAAAINLGLDIEADVHLTADNHLVLIHDDTLDRTTNGIGKVAEKTLAELKALDAGSSFGPTYKDVKIPTLNELLQLLKNTEWRPTMIALHMKGRSPGIEERVVRLVEKYQLLDQVIAFGLNPESAKHFQSANPSFPISVPGWTWDRDGNRKASVAEIESAHGEGKGVWLFGSCISRKPSCWENAIRVHVDGFLTHYPLEVREFWRQKGNPETKGKNLSTSKEATDSISTKGLEKGVEKAIPFIIAQGGLERFAPENTLPALAAAVSMGFGVELNIHQTKDSQLVVIHDEAVDRTTNGSGKVAEKTLAELRKLDAGAWFDSAYTNVKIPTLEEALETIKTSKWGPLLVAINLKATSAEVEEQIVKLVEKHQMMGEVFAFGMGKESAKRFNEINPQFSLSLKNHSFKSSSPSIAAEDYIITKHPLEIRKQMLGTKK